MVIIVTSIALPLEAITFPYVYDYNLTINSGLMVDGSPSTFALLRGYRSIPEGPPWSDKCPEYDEFNGLYFSGYLYACEHEDFITKDFAGWTLVALHADGGTSNQNISYRINITHGRKMQLAPSQTGTIGGYLYFYYTVGDLNDPATRWAYLGEKYIRTDGNNTNESIQFVTGVKPTGVLVARQADPDLYGRIKIVEVNSDYTIPPTTP